MSKEKKRQWVDDLEERLQSARKEIKLEDAEEERERRRVTRQAMHATCSFTSMRLLMIITQIDEPSM